MARHQNDLQRREAEESRKKHEEHMRDLEDEQKKSNEMGRKRKEA